MATSNTGIPLALLLGIRLALPAAADDLTLAGGQARLSGTVRSINAEGVVELASELSAAPLFLKSGSVEKIAFSAKPAAGDPPSTLVELANGDLLPATIESLDDQRLAVISPEAGRLEIPRESVKSLQFGIQRHKVIYQGPRSLEEWSEGGGEMKNWIFERDAVVSKGPSAASKILALPRQFILRFTLAWQQGMIPNFQVFFADPLVAKGEPCNRYYLQFGGAGLEIKREAAKGKRYNTIAILNRPSDQYPDNRLQVEIMVNRDASRMKLFLNGEPEGEFADPIADVPDGSGIALACNTPNGGSQEIRDIEIMEYDDSRRRHRAEERGNPGSDSLISIEDDRWSGRLLEIRNTTKGVVFVFKADFQEQPIEIPEADVSTVFFTAGNPKTDAQAPLPFVLRLPGEGSLSVASCQFTGESAAAVHPLLGPLAFRRGGIVAMERIKPATETVPEP
jgi:hypothetical protein